MKLSAWCPTATSTWSRPSNSSPTTSLLKLLPSRCGCGRRSFRPTGGPNAISPSSRARRRPPICYDRRLKTDQSTSAGNADDGRLAAPPASNITSAAPIRFTEKLRELGAIFGMRVSELFKPGSASHVLADLDEYEAMLKKYSVRGLKGARAFEIGFGARPLRLFALAASGADVTGSDLDVPLLRCSPREIAAMVRS